MMINQSNHQNGSFHDANQPDDSDLNLFNYDDDSDEEEQSNNPGNNKESSTTSAKHYRHFSTSICSMFHDPKDCCSFIFCGILQSDQTYFLLNGKRPPRTSFRYRVTAYAVVPFVLLQLGRFLMIMFTPNANSENGDSPVLLPFAIVGFSPLIFYIILQARWIHSWRLDVRRSILKRTVEYNRRFLHHEQESCVTNGSQPLDLENNAVEASAHMVLLRKNEPYNSQAHRLFCGCYPRDDREDSDEISLGLQQENFCIQLWNTLSSIFCGILCGCWCQCCGICAIAQEARQVKKITSRSNQMIDYITFEPYSNYFPKIHYLRSTGNSSFRHHFRSLSDLSHKLARALGIFLFIFFIYAVIDMNHGRNIGHWIMLVATFMQAFFIIYIVYWQNHHLTISLDAIIKYFASGFFLSTSLALSFEKLTSTIFFFMRTIFVIFIESFNTGGERNMQYISEFGPDDYYGYNHDNRDPNSIDPELAEVLKQIDWSKNHVFQVLMSNFITAFVIAALVEELCKYFSFYIVDHPDFFPSSSVLSAHPYSSESLDNKNYGIDQSNEIEMIESMQEDQTNDAHELVKNRIVQVDSDCVESLDSHSLVLSGTKITIAMVTVAVGFACNENLAYIFLGSWGKIGNELTILLQRSIFPIHPICAAMQSIGVCRRDLEGDKLFSMGRILSPAFILHGLFDFVVMSIPLLCMLPHFNEFKDYVIKINTEGSNLDEYDPLVIDIQSILGNANTYTMLTGFIITIVGFSYFLAESSLQKYRLRALDRENAESNSRLL